MPSLATPPNDTTTVASDATVRPVQRRPAGASPAADLAARAPEAAVPTTSRLHHGEGKSRTTPRTRAQPIGTRASAGKGDTPVTTNGLCLHGIRRASRTLFRRSCSSIGSSTAGHGEMPAVERPPRSSRTPAPLQAYKRGRCATTLPGTSARGASRQYIVVGSQRCIGASPVWRSRRRVSPFAAVAGRSTRVQVPPVSLQGALRP